MKTIITFLFCLNMTVGMAQTYPSTAIYKNNQAMTMANHYSHNKDSLKKAIYLLDEAIHLSPSYILAYQNKAQLLCWLGEPAEALNVVLAAEKQEPESPYICTFKGLLLEKNKNMAEAKKSYQRSVDIFHERFGKNSGSMADFENMLFSEFLLNNKILSLKEVRSLQKNLRLTLNTDDEQKFQNWFHSLYSPIERGKIMKGFEADFDKSALSTSIETEEILIIKNIKDFYRSYVANLEAGSDDANDALMNANMTQGLKAKVGRMASAVGANPVIRAQDFNINSIGTFRVQHLDGNWYMVSYAPDSSKKEKRINIPLRITKIDGRYLIDYITPEWNGSRYGDSLLCNKPALQEIDASSPESLLQTFYAAYLMGYSTMPADLSARLNKLREKYCTVNALKQIQAVAQVEEPMYDLLIGGSDFDYLWVPSVTYVRLNENTYRMSYKEGYGSVINVTLRVKKEGRMYRIDAIEVSESS